MKKSIINAIIILLFTIAFIIKDKTDVKADIQFCTHGGTGCCYKLNHGVGFGCGEGPWLDCGGTWVMPQ